jgi:sugar lactone lactonase YvrE
VVRLADDQLQELAEPRGGWRHPNAPLVLPDGDVLVSDSGRWRRDDGRLVRIRGNEATVVAEGIMFPNGRGLAGDGSVLLIESGTPALSRWDWGPSGRLERLEATSLPAAVPDGVLGLTDGSVLVACYRPDAVLRVTGDRVERLATDPTGLRLAAPTNLAGFGAERVRIAVACFGGYHLAELTAPAPAVAPWM